MSNDFSPYNYFRGSENCKLSSSGLEVLLKKGCYGTDPKKGCGLYGRAPITKKVTSATLEFTCVLPIASCWNCRALLFGKRAYPQPLMRCMAAKTPATTHAAPSGTVTGYSSMQGEIRRRV
jgi:hypothetical protein